MFLLSIIIGVNHQNKLNSTDGISLENMSLEALASDGESGGINDKKGKDDYTNRCCATSAYHTDYCGFFKLGC